MGRLTKRIDGAAHGAEGKSVYSLTGKWCRGEFECTALIEKLTKYEDAEENGLLLRLPCKVGQILFIDTNTLPTDKMKFDGVIPAFQKARVISIRINNKGVFIKVAVEAKFLEEWIDYETGPDCDYFEKTKYYTYPKSAIGKTAFLTIQEAEKALEERKRKQGED